MLVISVVFQRGIVFVLDPRVMCMLTCLSAAKGTGGSNLCLLYIEVQKYLYPVI